MTDTTNCRCIAERYDRQIPYRTDGGAAWASPEDSTSPAPSVDVNLVLSARISRDSVDQPISGIYDEAKARQEEIMKSIVRLLGR